MTKLIIRYEPDPDDEVGRLWFDFRGERFSGSAFFWSNLVEFPDMIENLGHYPLGDPAVWNWGYNASEGSDLILALSIAPDGSLGELTVTVELADLYDKSSRLKSHFRTEYNALDTLRSGLDLVVARRSGEAILLGC